MTVPDNNFRCYKNFLVALLASAVRDGETDADSVCFLGGLCELAGIEFEPFLAAMRRTALQNQRRSSALSVRYRDPVPAGFDVAEAEGHMERLGSPVSRKLWDKYVRFCLLYPERAADCIPEELFTALHGKGLSDSRIASALQLPRGAVLKRRLSLNLFSGSSRGGWPTPEWEKKFLDLYDRGLTDIQIANRCRTPRRLVAAYRRDAELPANSSPAPSVWRSRIPALCGQGMSDRQMAEALGKSLSSVKTVRRQLGLLPNRGKNRRRELDTEE